MASNSQKNSLLCPNCRRLVSRSAAECPYCGMSKPGSLLRDNIFTRGTGGEQSILRLILLCNIVLFVFSLLINFSGKSFSASPLNFLSPSNESLFVLGASGSAPIFVLGRYWTLLTANYLHGGLLHIVFNMIAVYQLGPLMIREYGKNRMFVIYTIGGVGGYIVSAFAGVYFTIGASASVCAMIGALLYYGRSRGGVYGQAVYSQIGSWAIFLIVFGFIVPGINNWGHGGGMACGFLLGWLLGYQDRNKETINHKFLSMACMIVTGLLLLWSLLNGLVYFFQ